ncbi:MAG: rhomboid family intramembrane serine protease [Candidatus Marinimicrobia bacterium]|nr:rhomboid family intramembrane serine protease [Candidatus Neomarinimicrobiota bacterium]
MFIPYRDDNPRILTPYVTYAILALNILVFLFQLGLDSWSEYEFTLSYGLIPAKVIGVANDTIIQAHEINLRQVTRRPINLEAQPHTPLITIFTSMFMHGGLGHLLFNMLFLWIFADNMESGLGHRRFAVFYLLSGVGAALIQIIMNISSITPMIGASGAIAGVLGAYMFRYPRARVHVFVFLLFFITTMRVPAFVVLGFWFLTQLSNGLGSLGINTTGGVAWFAHIGGFLTGVILDRIFRIVRFERK